MEVPHEEKLLLSNMRQQRTDQSIYYHSQRQKTLFAPLFPGAAPKVIRRCLLHGMQKGMAHK
jgi:hypothetical protein